MKKIVCVVNQNCMHVRVAIVDKKLFVKFMHSLRLLLRFYNAKVRNQPVTTQFLLPILSIKRSLACSKHLQEPCKSIEYYNILKIPYNFKWQTY